MTGTKTRPKQAWEATQVWEAAKVIRLASQPKRASFARREMRKQGLTVQLVAELSGRAWQTVQKYMDLSPSLQPTKNPATDTTVSIFHALGYDVVLTRSKGSKGTVSL